MSCAGARCFHRVRAVEFTARNARPPANTVGKRGFPERVTPRHDSVISDPGEKIRIESGHLALVLDTNRVEATLTGI